MRLCGDRRGNRVTRSAGPSFRGRACRRHGPGRPVVTVTLPQPSAFGRLTEEVSIPTGTHHHHGAFAEYLVTRADFVVHVPDAWSFEDAAQLGVAPLTALRVLYDVLKLPEPEPLGTTSAAPLRKSPVLISGGATSVGLYAVQFAKLSGLYVIATASRRNFDLVRSLGVDVVVDYADPVAAAKQIREAAPDLENAVDCVGEDASTAIVAAALNGKGTIGQITLRPIPVEGVRTLSSIIFDVIGKVRAILPHPSTANRTPPLIFLTSCLLLHRVGLRFAAAFHRISRVGRDWARASAIALGDRSQDRSPSKPGADPAAGACECRRRVPVHERGEGTICAISRALELSLTRL